MLHRVSLLLFCAIMLSTCTSGYHEETTLSWTNDLSIYEIMPKQYSEKRNFEGITEDLSRIKSMFFNSICLLPVQKRDETNNAYNPNSPIALNSFEQIDPTLGTAEQLIELLDSAHHKKLKVFIEWNFSVTGPNHEWRVKKPEYYLSNEKLVNNAYNQDYVKLNGSNTTLQNDLLSSFKKFMTKFEFDGVICFDLNRMPSDFVEKLKREMNSIRPMLFINHSDPIMSQCHFNWNSNLLGYFQRAYNGNLSVKDIDGMLDTVRKFSLVNAVQDYLETDKFGPDAILFYNAYKYYHMLTYFLPGIPWVLNGQEDPQFETISLYSQVPVSKKFKYNTDFYRSLNRLKQQNPALWNSNLENLPVKISDSDEVLALERKSGKYVCIGMFNLTDHIASYTLKNDYNMLYDAFNKTQISFPKNTELKLGPFQALILSNIP